MKRKLALLLIIPLTLTGCGSKLPVTEEEMEYLLNNEVGGYKEWKNDIQNNIEYISQYELNILSAMSNYGKGYMLDNYVYTVYESEHTGELIEVNKELPIPMGSYTKTDLLKSVEYDFNECNSILDNKFNKDNSKTEKENTETEKLEDSAEEMTEGTPEEVTEELTEENTEELTEENTEEVTEEASEVEIEVSQNNTDEESYTENKDITEENVEERDSDSKNEVTDNSNEANTDNIATKEEDISTENSIEVSEEVTTEKTTTEIELSSEEQAVVDTISEILGFNSEKKYRTQGDVDLSLDYSEVTFNQAELKALIILSDIDIRYYYDEKTEDIHQIFIIKYKNNSYLQELVWNGGIIVETKNSRNFVSY